MKCSSPLLAKALAADVTDEGIVVGGIGGKGLRLRLGQRRRRRQSVALIVRRHLLHRRQLHLLSVAVVEVDVAVVVHYLYDLRRVELELEEWKR